MTKFLVLACSLVLIVSCSRRTVPSKPNTVLENNNGNGSTTDASSPDNGAIVIPDMANTTTSAALVMVVADGYGRLITTQENLPQNTNVKYNSLQLSKGFTVQQRANLQARYKSVPPRVLYVPQEYVSNSLKGSYYIYRNKFWYWKKTDGLFYLDEKYYL